VTGQCPVSQLTKSTGQLGPAWPTGSGTGGGTHRCHVGPVAGGRSGEPERGAELRRARDSPVVLGFERGRSRSKADDGPHLVGAVASPEMHRSDGSEHVGGGRFGHAASSALRCAGERTKQLGVAYATR
jgi:hypothetical protein